MAFFHSLLVFTAAFLIFQIELIAAKALLPRFGGSYLVWGTSVTFFQFLLLLGYLFAHQVRRQITSRWWLLLPAGLFVLTAAVIRVDLLALQLPLFAPPVFSEIPGMLFAAIGPQFFLLSIVSILAQYSFVECAEVRNNNPYVLYATSSLGSFAGLLCYPFITERYSDLIAQEALVQYGFAVVAALVCILAYSSFRAFDIPGKTTDLWSPLPLSIKSRWLCLGAAGSALFLAVTNIITMDIAAIPLLWIVPLSIYLLSFVPTFRERPWYPQALQVRFSGFAAICFFLFELTNLSYKLPLYVALLSHLLLLLAGCLIVNGALSVSKPRNTAHLGEFYFFIALGGLAGSIIISWIIPLISTKFIELPVAFLLAALGLSHWEGFRIAWGNSSARAATLLLAMILWPLAQGMLPGALSGLVAILFGLMGGLCWYRLENRPQVTALLLLVVTLAAVWVDPMWIGGTLRYSHRNYYGIYKVFDHENTRFLKHGTTLHGMQYLEPENRYEALAYYHVTTPVGEFLSLNPFNYRSIAIVGLGAGSLAAYGKQGQRMDFYELDPDSEYVARTYFSYLSDSKADINLVVGDARLSLSKVSDAAYDLLIIDAFNSDSIPIHLLTVEAFALYSRVVRPDGLIMLHVSNKYLDLKPVVAATSHSLNLTGRYKTNFLPAKGAQASEWFAVTGSAATVSTLENLGWKSVKLEIVKKTRPWTDQYTDPIFAVKG